MTTETSDLIGKRGQWFLDGDGDHYFKCEKCVPEHASGAWIQMPGPKLHWDSQDNLMAVTCGHCGFTAFFKADGTRVQ